MGIVEQILGKELFQNRNYQNPVKKGCSVKDRRDSRLNEADLAVLEKWEECNKSFEGKFNSREDLLSHLEQYPCSPFSILRKPDARKMKVFNAGVSLVSMAELNAVIEACKNYFKFQIEFTPSKSIKMARRFTCREGWGIRVTSKGRTELIIISFRGMWRIQCRGKGEKATTEYGTQSWREFTKDCKKEGIDLEEIAVPAGREAERVKSEVPKPSIKVIGGAYKGMTIDNVNHVDIHSAHCYFIEQEFPQLKPVIDKYYALRKDPEVGKKMKQRLVNLSGYSESQGVKFRFSKMAKAAKIGTNKKVDEILAELQANGRFPLLVNTDGVWYRGDVYNFKDEGDGIGQLHTDHRNCKFRFKSAGVYEYEDEEGYHVAMRGRTSLDILKPNRKDWTWGDIYKSGGVVKFEFDSLNMKFNIKVDVDYDVSR